jgi:hypothetical protein
MPQHWVACHQVEGFDAAPLAKPSLDHKRQFHATTIGGEA